MDLILAKADDSNRDRKIPPGQQTTSQRIFGQSIKQFHDTISIYHRMTIPTTAHLLIANLFKCYRPECSHLSGPIDLK